MSRGPKATIVGYIESTIRIVPSTALIHVIENARTFLQLVQLAETQLTKLLL